MQSAAWDQRIQRAEELARLFPFAAEILRFYSVVARFQKALYGYIHQAHQKSPPSRVFRDSLDLSLLLPRFSGFLNTVKEAAPPQLADCAARLSAEPEARWEELLSAFWLGAKDLPHAHAFCARAFLQPYAAFVAARLAAPLGQGETATCPVCDSEPVVGVLREEQLGARRSFICSLCAYEWSFPRAVCPGCGEHRNEALAVFTSDNFVYVRVEACDTCKCYIKTVDLTRNGLAVPVVDELAAVPLTLWAQEHGYIKLQPNLLAV
ncbi:MAG: formate dehydrogenase accessory protein FdhE [Acidobacteria bacterium]|nr:formate dehydrogenase accessory protein FdhE [Acidobacteriota bacterium]